MNRTTVITMSSRVPDPVKEPYYHLKEFRASCERRNIQPVFLQGEWRGLITKPKALLAHLEREGARFDHIVFLDAWDIILCADVEEMVEKFKAFGKPIVFNTERACFPRADFTDRFPESESPYRFLNSGFIIGETEAMVTMLRGMNLGECRDDYQKPDGSWVGSNDQENFQSYYLEHPESIALDYGANLCQSLHLAGEDEFFVDAPRIRSRLTGNTPAVFHGNGGGKAWLEKIIGWMGL